VQFQHLAYKILDILALIFRSVLQLELPSFHQEVLLEQLVLLARKVFRDRRAPKEYRALLELLERQGQLDLQDPPDLKALLEPLEQQAPLVLKAIKEAQELLELPALQVLMPIPPLMGLHNQQSVWLLQFRFRVVIGSNQVRESILLLAVPIK
jgi:hypothetical protein